MEGCKGRHFDVQSRATLSLVTPLSTMHRLWNCVNETRVGPHTLNALFASTEVSSIVSRAS